MYVANSCKYYSTEEECCRSCMHGAYVECERYRREQLFSRVSCLGRFTFAPTGFGVTAHRNVKVVWGTDSELLKNWILEDSLVGRFRVVRMDMVEIKELVLNGEGNYDDRIEDGLGISVNRGGGVYLDLSGITHDDIYDRGNTMFSILRNFLFLCAQRGVRVYVDCNCSGLSLLPDVTRRTVVGQNVFVAEFMCGGIGYRLIEGETHALLVETPESRYLRGGIGDKTALMGLVPYDKWLMGKGRCRVSVSGNESLTENERRLLLSAPLMGTLGNDTEVDGDVRHKTQMKLYTEGLGYSPVESVQSVSVSDNNGRTEMSKPANESAQMEFVKQMNAVRKEAFAEKARTIKKSGGKKDMSMFLK